MESLDMKLKLDIKIFENGTVSVGGGRWGGTTNVARFLKGMAEEQDRKGFFEFKHKHGFDPFGQTASENKGDDMKEAQELVRLAKELVSDGKVAEFTVRVERVGEGNVVSLINAGKKEITIQEARPQRLTNYMILYDLVVKTMEKLG